MKRNLSSDSAQSHRSQDSTVESFYLRQNKVLRECFDALVAQKEMLDVYEPLSSDTSFQRLNQTLETVIGVVEELQLVISNDVALEDVLVQIITKIQKIKKENALLKRSLADARSPPQPPWSGFREKPGDASSEEAYKAEASVVSADESGSRSSMSHGRYDPASFGEHPFDGFIGDLERCRIDSQRGSPTVQSPKDQYQRPPATTDPLVTTSVGSSTESISARHHVTESCLADLRANKLDLIFEADRQKGAGDPDFKSSVAAWVDDIVLETAPDEVPPKDTPLTPEDSDSELRLSLTFPGHLSHITSLTKTVSKTHSVRPAPPTQGLVSIKIGGIFAVVLGILALTFFIVSVYNSIKAMPFEGFFDRNSRELDYYKRVYGW